MPRVKKTQQRSVIPVELSVSRLPTSDLRNGIIEWNEIDSKSIPTADMEQRE